jgi:hypothetical protein
MSKRNIPRKSIFTGRYGIRERRAFYEFISKRFPSLRRRLIELIVNSENNPRVSVIFQIFFVEFCEKHVLENENTCKELLRILRIRTKEPLNTLKEIVESIKYRRMVTGDWVKIRGGWL